MPTTPPTTASPRLDADQVAAFNRDGYALIKEPILEPATFDRLRADFERMLTEWVADPRSASPEHMDTPHFLHPSLLEYAFDDRILDLVEPILGPDLALFSSHFICKPPAVGKRVPWHEDSAYWKGRLDPMHVVTVWLAIDPSTPDNGCMQVIPGTHVNGYSDYEDVKDTAVFGSEIRRGSFKLDDAVDCVLAPNEASLHDARTIHGSAANTGTMRRCGWTLRFISAATKFNAADAHDGFQIYLARGKDRAGNTYGDPTTVNQAYIDAHPDGFPQGH
ncbi:MAG: phytanoyl-CoA dioxygenase family protein [Planctomycetota bacterium]